MERHVTIIGAGVIGMCAASYLQRAGRKVTVIDSVAPGEGCSFGNAGGLSTGACVPLALPGVLKQVPKWLFDKEGPLVLRPGYLPKALPWLWKFMQGECSGTGRKERRRAPCAHEPAVRQLRTAACGSECQRSVPPRTASSMSIRPRKRFEGDAFGRELRRSRGIPFDLMDGEELRQMEPDLKPIFKRAMFMPEHGNCMNPFRLVGVARGCVQAQRR